MPVTGRDLVLRQVGKVLQDQDPSRCRAGSDCSADTRPDGPGPARRPGGTARDRSITRRRSRDSAAPRSGWSRGPWPGGMQGDQRVLHDLLRRGEVGHQQRGQPDQRPVVKPVKICYCVCRRRCPGQFPPAPHDRLPISPAGTAPVTTIAPLCVAAASMRSGIRRGQHREAARLRPASRPAHPGGRPPQSERSRPLEPPLLLSPTPITAAPAPGHAEPQQCDIDAVRTATM